MAAPAAGSSGNFTRRTRLAFLVLVLFQTLHSIEEYSTRLYDHLATARFISRLFSENLALGFAIFNTCVVAFGFWAYLVPVRSASVAGRRIAWAWAGMEFANSLGHLAFAISAGGYFSGVATAPLLAAAAIVLALFLHKDGQLVTHAGG